MLFKAKKKTTEVRELTLHWESKCTEENIWVRGTLDTVGPNEGNRSTVMNGKMNLTAPGSESTGLVLLWNTFWPLRPLQMYPVLNFLCLNEITTLLGSALYTDEPKLTVSELCHPVYVSLAPRRTQWVLLYRPSHILTHDSLQSAPAGWSTCSRHQPCWELTPWTQAHRPSSGLSSSSLRHATLCLTFPYNHSHAWIWTKMWGEQRRKMGRKQGREH